MMESSSPITRRALLAGAALLAAGPAGGQPARTPVTLAAAGEGSAFLEYANALKAVVEQHAPVSIEIVPTRGSNENAELLEAGRVDFACLSLGPAHDAWNGFRPFLKRPLRRLRAVLPMYQIPYHALALRQRGIDAIRDLKGKEVGVGPEDGPGEVFLRGVAEGLGMRPRIVTGTPAALADLVLKGEIDAFWYGAGLPAPPFEAIAEQADVVIFGFDQAAALELRRRFPYFLPFEIPPDTYRGQTKAISSLSVWSFLATHEGVAADLVHALTQATLEHTAALRERFEAAAATVRANAASNGLIPFHPGAERYYAQTNVVLPRGPAAR